MLLVKTPPGLLSMMTCSPYADNNASFWSGYFTSRANHKEYARVLSQKTHAFSKIGANKVLDLLYVQKPEQRDDISNIIMPSLEKAYDAVGVLQHHDAITGTAKQAVADDYSRIVSEAIAASGSVAESLIAEMVSKITTIKEDEYKPFLQCLKTNSTCLDCPIAEYITKASSGNVLVAVQNPALLQLNQVSFAVPYNYTFTVNAYNATTNQF